MHDAVTKVIFFLSSQLPQPPPPLNQDKLDKKSIGLLFLKFATLFASRRLTNLQTLRCETSRRSNTRELNDNEIHIELLGTKRDFPEDRVFLNKLSMNS